MGTADTNHARMAVARKALAGAVRVARELWPADDASRVWNLGGEAARYALRNPGAPLGFTAEEAREACEVTVAEAPDFIAGWAAVHAFPAV